jgi:hypothetical protein
VTGITGAAIMAGGVIAGAIIGLTSATLATAVVVVILGLLFAVPVLVVLAAVALAIGRHLLAPDDPDPGLCDDDGTGNCTRCAPVGDDAVRQVTGPSDADIEQMIREWKGGRP